MAVGQGGGGELGGSGSEVRLHVLTAGDIGISGEPGEDFNFGKTDAELVSLGLFLDVRSGGGQAQVAVFCL